MKRDQSRIKGYFGEGEEEIELRRNELASNDVHNPIINEFIQGSASSSMFQ